MLLPAKRRPLMKCSMRGVVIWRSRAIHGFALGLFEFWLHKTLLGFQIERAKGIQPVCIASFHSRVGSSWECQRALSVGHAMEIIGLLAARHKDDLAVFDGH